MLLTLIITILILPSLGLIGYDCGTRSLNVTILSLIEVGAYNIPPSTYNITKSYIQLLQVNNFVETKVVQCKLEVQRNVLYCGWNSYNSAVEYGWNEYVYDIRRKACEDLYITSILRFGNTYVVSGMKVNESRTFHMVYTGHLDKDGNCKGESCSDPFGSWESVVVHGILKITILERVARVDNEENKIYAGRYL